MFSLSKGDSEDSEGCFPPPPLSFQSEQNCDLEDLPPPPPPQQFGKESPTVGQLCRLIKQKPSTMLNQKQYSRIERFIDGNLLMVMERFIDGNVDSSDNFSLSSFKESKFIMKLTSSSSKPLLESSLTKPKICCQ